MGFLLNDLPDAFIFLDENSNIVRINPAGEKLLKISKGELVGRSLVEVFSGRFIFRSSDSSQLEGFTDSDSSPANGDAGFTEIKVSSLQDPAGNFLGRIAILRALRSSRQPEALLNQNEILLALQETAFELHSSMDLNKVLPNIVERACKLLGTSHAYLDILRETGELEPVVGFGELEVVLGSKVVMGEGLAGIVWETGRPLLIPDYDKWSGRLSQVQPGLIRAVLGMPLILNEQVVGVIGIARGVESEASFSEEDITVLKRFATLAVLALRNARLFEKAQAEIKFRRKTEMELRNANQVLQFQIERVELLQGQLQELAVRDSLTNLFNRRYLEETLEVELARARRSESSLAILMLDCDRLKQINDTYGHKAGDDSLVLIANVIRESIRAGDIACRYGGDEFVVVLSNVSRATAFERAEKLRNRIAERPIRHKKEKIYLNVSVGIAMFPVNGTFGETLLQRADQALYEAKRKGRNQVLVYRDDLE